MEENLRTLEEAPSKSFSSWVLVAQACNPSYSGGKIRRIAV
jgi:hypothetical protein